MSLLSFPFSAGNTGECNVNLDLFLKGDDMDTTDNRYRRMLPAEWFPQSFEKLTWPHRATDWAYMI